MDLCSSCLLNAACVPPSLVQLRESPLCTQKGNAALGNPAVVTPGTAVFANKGELRAALSRQAELP